MTGLRMWMGIAIWASAWLALVGCRGRDAPKADHQTPGPGEESVEAPVEPVVEPLATPHARIALTNATVIDGTGQPARTGQTIVVESGQIAAVGDAADVAIPDGATQRDVTGKTVIPGLIMMHEHMFYPSGQRHYTQHGYSFPRLYLAGGVTTMRTAGSMSPYADLNLKHAIDAGRIPGPDVVVTGPFLNGPGLNILQVNDLSGADDARRMTAYWADEGITSFKAYMHISTAELAAVIDEAHQRKHKVTGHLCSITFREAADAGIDCLEHGFLVSSDFVADKRKDECPNQGAIMESLLAATDADTQALIDHLVARRVAITSTLTVFETFTPDRPRAPDAALDLMIPEVRAQYLDAWSEAAQSVDSPWIALLDKEMKLELAFARAGGLLLVGTDPTGYGGVVPGFANHRALELLVEAGFSAEEAIEIGTRNGARYLGREAEIGTIAPGKRADLVVIDGDVSADIHAVRNVTSVFKRGVEYSAARLIELARGKIGLH